MKNFSKEDILETLGIQTGGFWSAALIGFGAGCLVGAAIAVLVTPKSGAELRSNIRETGKSLLNRGKEMATRPDERGHAPIY
jgi:hypothetical protein